MAWFPVDPLSLTADYWTRLLVSQVHDGRVAGIWEFDPEDQAAAFACAAKQV